MYPTNENMQDLIQLWLYIQEKGAVFSDQWRRVVWQNPDLDYSLRRPVNNAAVRQYDAQRNKLETAQLYELARDHGLIYFFSSTCPYCKAMAPTLKMLSNQYGFEILGVSIDGGTLPDFPSPADGRSQALNWGVTKVPALFIGSKETGDHAPIGFGMMALSDMVKRILVLTSTRPGENF
jgi:conjugal transfer pilus assembly protein TraF